MELLFASSCYNHVVGVYTELLFLPCIIITRSALSRRALPEGVKTFHAFQCRRKISLGWVIGQLEESPVSAIVDKVGSAG